VEPAVPKNVGHDCEDDSDEGQRIEIDTHSCSGSSGFEDVVVNVVDLLGGREIFSSNYIIFCEMEKGCQL